MNSISPNKRMRSSSLDNSQDVFKEWFCSEEDHGIHLVPRGMLTRGGFGEIHMGIDTKRSKVVAIKTIPRALASPAEHGKSFAGEWGIPPNNNDNQQRDQRSPQLNHDVFHEICALRLLQGHANIVTLLAVFPSSDLPGAVSFAFSYHPVDLHTALEFRRRQFPPSRLLPLSVIRAIAHDLFSALMHCHSCGVLHRDVTPGNLLISYGGVIQLTDFGLAKPATQMVTDQKDDAEQSLALTSKGICTLYYRAPEVLLGGPAKHSSVDMYSAGLVLTELVSGGQPMFPGRNVIDQLGLVFRVLGTPSESHWPEATSLPDFGKVNFVPQSPKAWTKVLPRVLELDGLENVLSGLIALDPMKRWSAERTLKSSWLEGQRRACGQQVAGLLIPVHLCCEPLLLWASDQNHAFLQAQGLASSRRSILSKDSPEWR